MTPLGFALVGLVLLMLAGDKLVAGAAGVAQRYQVSPLLVGIVIIGFGTSLPEMLASALATYQGAPDIALGNVVGSNIANMGLVLALALLLVWGRLSLRASQFDYLLMLLVLLVFTLLGWFHPWFGVITGVCLLVGLLAYLGASVVWASASDAPTAETLNLPIAILYIVLGLVGLIAGAKLLVDGATSLAIMLGVSEKIIGITLVAVGTSLPELAAAIAAARRNQLALTVGNILGSNVFNVLAVLGVAATIAPLNATHYAVDLFVMLLLATLLAPLFMLRRNPLPAPVYGVLLLVVYTAYMVWLSQNGATPNG